MKITLEQHIALGEQVMKQCADAMAEHGAEFEAIGEHATELAGAARIARGWAKELRKVKA